MICNELSPRIFTLKHDSAPIFSQTEPLHVPPLLGKHFPLQNRQQDLTLANSREFRCVFFSFNKRENDLIIICALEERFHVHTWSFVYGEIAEFPVIPRPNATR